MLKFLTREPFFTCEESEIQSYKTLSQDQATNQSIHRIQTQACL